MPKNGSHCKNDTTSTTPLNNVTENLEDAILKIESNSISAMEKREKTKLNLENQAVKIKKK